jgi:hypothetical protein
MAPNHRVYHRQGNSTSFPPELDWHYGAGGGLAAVSWQSLSGTARFPNPLATKKNDMAMIG